MPSDEGEQMPEAFKKDNTRLKILFVHNSLPEYRKAWFKELAEISECKFIITNSTLAKEIYGFQTNAQDIPCILLNSGISGIRQFIKELKGISNFDFVELPPMDSLGEYIKAVLLFRAAQKAKVKTGYFWEKWDAPKEKQPFIRRIKNTILKTVGKTLFLKVDVVFSSGLKNREYFLKAGVYAERIVNLPDSTELPPCELLDIYEQYEIPQGKKIILYFGRIIRQKGLDILLKAIWVLPEDIKRECFLLVAGDGDFKKACEQLSDFLKLDNVKFIGAVDPAQRRLFYEQCDVYVHPGTYYQGRTDVWGLTLNEAVQCGKIIIATTAVGSAYNLITDKNGRMVEENNVKALSEALIACITNESMVLEAKKENKRIYEKYNCRNMAYVYLKGVEKTVR